ncbi:MAG: P1 family peptidase, partial [Vicinamibacteria bacterium]|nr:P1 family peptidase [Vicinamibacteria bacterium]
AASPRPTLPGDALSPLFQAALEATEEAVLNSLLRATTTTGRGGRTIEALPLELVRRDREPPATQP